MTKTLCDLELRSRKYLAHPVVASKWSERRKKMFYHVYCCIFRLCGIDLERKLLEFRRKVDSWKQAGKLMYRKAVKNKNVKLYLQWLFLDRDMQIIESGLEMRAVWNHIAPEKRWEEFCRIVNDKLEGRYIWF